ncbi:hypothetical protein OG985_48210 [Streptomyces sp. NBC_00289]|uniref:hypothetical protein n=1 Tax=Streptomyces sp. NBC_00289 TaxID=2975703 RepID=UPI003244CB6E
MGPPAAEYGLERMLPGADMCAYLLATDVDMAPLDGFDLTGWEQGFGDVFVQPDLPSIRVLPHRCETALIIGTALHRDDTPIQVAPRHLLQTQLARLAELGYWPAVGVEVEAVLYQQDDSGRRAPAGAGAGADNRDYGLQHPPLVADFIHDLSRLIVAGIRYEAIKVEAAPGQIEVSLAYDAALTACDDYAVFRDIAHDVAGRRSMVPAFMAAPETGIGNGLHLRLSLRNEHGDPAFAQDRDQGPSPLMQQALAGLLPPRVLGWFCQRPVTSSSQVTARA